MNRVGIMQGRLSPMIDERIQAFPSTTWRDEFALARDCGFDLIEWVLDVSGLEQNPLLSTSGRAEIERFCKEHGIDVPGVCCDYFMDYSLKSHYVKAPLRPEDMLKELIKTCPAVGIRYVEIPMLGESGLKGDEDAEWMVSFMNGVVPLAERNDVDLLLEMSLPAKEISTLLEQIPSPRIKINYDTGNSAYWGYEPREEISAYGNRIGNVHIKDCTPADYSVPLGQGNVDFDLIFQLLRDSNYQGDFILQTARGEDDVQTAKTFYKFVCYYVQKYLS